MAARDVCNVKSNMCVEACNGTHHTGGTTLIQPGHKLGFWEVHTSGLTVRRTCSDLVQTSEVASSLIGTLAVPAEIRLAYSDWCGCGAN